MTNRDELPAIFQKIASNNFQEKVEQKSTTVEQQAASVISDLAEKYPSWAMADVLKLKRLFNDAHSISGEARVKIIKDELYRVSHDIKGQGATFGYPLMTDMAAHLCNYIKLFDTYNADQMKIIKMDIDDLETILTHKLSGEGGEDGAAMLYRIHQPDVVA